ncbi:MAG: FxsA family protein [Methylococcaceae bacterium]|jgi:UPF0716 protein FxsA
MKVFQILFLLCLLIPFAEIYLLLQIGAVIGVFPTIILVVFTAVLGAWQLRQQGFETFRRLQASLARGELPAYEMIEGPILLVGGAFLLTPGFVTDCIGFMCLIPSLRRKFASYLLEKHLVKMANRNGQQATQVIEGEYHKEE